MHTNHRRKNKHRAKHHNRRYFPLAYSLKPQKRQKSRDRRAVERHLMAHDRFDDLPTAFPKSIYWEYW